MCVEGGVARRSLVGLALFLLASSAGCIAGEGAEDTASSEDDLRFESSVIDTSLPDVDALGYEVDLRVDDALGHETYRADVTGTYTATRDLDELALDFDGNVIDEVYASDRRAEHRREGAQLFVKLPAPVAKGKTFTTRITYHGDVSQADGTNPNDFASFGGFMVKQRNAEAKRIFTTLSWPSKARRWLPLRDHPADGAMVALTATFPTSYHVISNGKKVSETPNADGTKTWTYEALTTMPTYAFHVSAYEGWQVDESSSQSGVPITTVTYANAVQYTSAVYGDLTKVMDFYEASLGKYRWGTAAFIEEPIFGGGMEHATVVSMDETLFRNPEAARRTAFHELAHHWSGNLVRFRTWNDFWLSEGFTDYLTARARAHVDGPDEDRRVYREYLSSVLSADRMNPHALAPRGDEIDVLSIFDDIPYKKGALTLRMLERIVGAEKMIPFLQGWFSRHAFAAMTSEDLRRELGEASGVDLTKFFATFVYEAYHPEVRVTLASAGAETEIMVEQIQTQGPDAGFVFPLDIDLVDAQGTKERVVVELTDKTTTKRVQAARAPVSVVVDPDERAIVVAACAQGSACKDGYRCAPQAGAVSVCVP
jgi:aminopeptidase N